MVTGLSDEWFYGGARRRSGSRLLPVLVILLVFINSGLIGYVYVTNRESSIPAAQIAVLQSTVDSLKSQITVARSDIASLRASINQGTPGGQPPTAELPLGLLYNRTRPSVVQITVTTSTGGGTGSGFIYDTLGDIVTNNHVVENAKEIQVTFTDGTTVKAELMGRDPYSDMAVIRVSASPSLLIPLTLGDSGRLKVGQTVIAIGNPFGLAGTMTTGIISALGRQMETPQRYPIVDVIQTDAAINPGNSGGPLLNLDGEVIGMNTAIEGEVRQSSGVGFAVPSNTISREVPDLIAKGVYSHPYVGINGVDVSTAVIEAMKLPASTRGTLVAGVTPSGPAAVAGLVGGDSKNLLTGTSIPLGGDVITGADGKPMRTFTDLISYIQRTKKPGDSVALQLIRNGGSRDVTLILGIRPPP